MTADRLLATIETLTARGHKIEWFETWEASWFVSTVPPLRQKR